VGDRILAYAGQQITGIQQLRHWCWSREGKVAIKVVRLGRDLPLELNIEPAGEPVRLGLAWRVDEAEPGAVLLVGITPGSPAEQAGLKLYDRIYEINGRRFSSSEEFRQLTNFVAQPAGIAD